MLNPFGEWENADINYVRMKNDMPFNWQSVCFIL